MILLHSWANRGGASGKLPTDHDVPAPNHHHHRSKRRQLLIGGGRRRRGHITELGRRRRSRLRRGRTSRGWRAGLRARVLTSLIPVDQPESHESGERRGYPRPDARGAARPFGTTPLIVAARIGVAWVRHDSTPFLVDQRY